MDGRRRVVVTGIAMITAAGMDKETFMKHAAEGRSGLRGTLLFPTDKLRTDYFGETPKRYAYEIQAESDESRTEQIFGDLAEELLRDAGLDAARLADLDERAIFSFATSVGTNDYMTAHVKQVLPDSVSRGNLHKLPPKLGIRGATFVNTSACSAGTTAIGTAFSMIRAGLADLAAAGGVDPLTEFSTYGFHSLQNLSALPCRPFDRRRDGITLGEGGALFMLEEREAALSRGARIYAEVLGYGLGNDAYHPTSPDPTGQGAYRVMRQAVRQGGIESAEVDYVNAHGTGTVINDDMEAKAIALLRPDCRVSSTKSLTGHCLAAAGAVEAAATALALKHGSVPPTAGLDEPDFEDAPLRFVRGRAEPVRLRYALSNSFAFGGNAASLLLGAHVDRDEASPEQPRSGFARPESAPR
ncbi:3-oxoacyl-ACP synthase [Saccharibacillus sp. O23]|uniref:beta-ketoacyl-[acyl-carrier-protein] synthase family protein n=1 Tax=Saccharibacillus sp. O23 TaxID=2009338 RepID=UPI000B4DF190|nr:beta-ketoacyl-[acyl-carrier-protein] synthase family protein [Saccharibacillus sp. O23]OWR33182.1 3-oxoacyl-ACP synthase [Saccharibacillus sp. O23]